MNIVIYTINDCPFCKSEKQYFTSHNISFIEKNLESNREYLEEMMAVSNKFAGVPFTVITRDDGTTIKLKGYTKEEFDAALGIVDNPVAEPAPQEQVQEQKAQPEVPQPEQPKPEAATEDLDLPPLTPKETVASEPPASEPVASPPPAQNPIPGPIPTAQDPVAASPADPPSTDALDKVLSSLEGLSTSSSSSTQPGANPYVMSAAPAAATPTSTDAPQIPDFKE